MTTSDLMSTSPSVSSLISTPGAGGPTVPILILSGGLTVPAPHVSLIPHSSLSGRPIAWKNSSTSTRRRRRADVDRDDLVESELRPQAGEDRLVGLGDAARRAPSGTASPRCSSRTFSVAAAMAPSILARVSSSWPAIIVSSPALSFSQMRGTAKNHAGRTSGRRTSTWRGSSQHVICRPKTIGR